MTFVADETDEGWPSSIAALQKANAFVIFPDPFWLPVLREEVTGGIRFVKPGMAPLARVRTWREDAWASRTMGSTAVQCRPVIINERYCVCFLAPAAERVNWAEVKRWINEKCPGKQIKDSDGLRGLFERINYECP